jgi:K+-sensing histidine kinase KdpD
VITSASPEVQQPEEQRQVQVLRDETEVEATRRLRDAVLAQISHEFKTPLAAQLASLELLLSQLPELTMDQIGQLVLALQRGTLRLTQLIDNLLESVRIESGRDTIRRRPLILDEVLEQSLELTRPLIELRGQRIDVELPYPLPSPVGDGARMTQVFVNLLANASKYAPVGTAIRVAGAVGAREVTLWVDDEGPGISPGAEQTVFERFERAAGGEEPEQSGMGLGLWIVKSIVERHGGRVTAARRPAGGTRVAVSLPVEERSRHEDSNRG